MFNRIIQFLGASKMLPEDILKKGIEKIDPRMKKFFSESSKYGYPLGATLGFLRSELVSGDRPVDRSLRPDEAANIEINRQRQGPRKLVGPILSTLGGGALGALGGAALEGAGNLLGSPQEQNKEQSQIVSQEPVGPSGFANFISKHPELGAFLDQLMKKGMSPIQAATEAKKVRNLMPMIMDIEHNIGQSLEDILAQLFKGTDKLRLPADQASGQQKGQNVDAALLAAFEKILKM